MKIGLIGLPQVGKSTLFELLTQHQPTESELASNKPIKAVAEIKDPRFEKLVQIYQPKKQVRARIDIEMLPKLEQDTIKQGDIFVDINELDAICHVVRAFAEETVYHVAGSVEAKRDIDSVNSELIIHDLLFIEKRLERVAKEIKKKNEDSMVKESQLLVKLKAHLEQEWPLRLLELNPEEKKITANYPFVTVKNLIIALNVSERDLKNTALLEQLQRDYHSAGIQILQVSAKVEAEIARLESASERSEFLKELGISEPAIDLLARLCIQALNLISFFTVGQDEVRQWTIRAGSSAPEAAGAIHSDLQRGFIRAEVIKYSDLLSLGSEEKIKQAGKFYLKGKDYLVEDADILNIRFN